MADREANAPINRREFLAAVGGAGLAVGLAAEIGCGEVGSKGESPFLHVNVPALVSSADLIYQSPAAAPAEGQPIGNGRMGTLVWTEPSKLCMQVNRCDVFAVNRNHGGARDGPADYCGACAQVSIDVGGTPFRHGPDFLQRLSVYEAEETIRGEDVAVRCLVSSAKDLLAVEVDDRRQEPQPMRVTISMWREPRVTHGDHLAAYEFVDSPNPTLVQRFEERDHSCRSAVAVEIRGSATLDSQGPRFRTWVAPAASGRRTILISSAAAWPPDEDPGAAASALLARASDLSYADLREEHRGWWAAFWSRTFVALSSSDGLAEFMGRLRTLHLYLLASTSRGKLPAKWNGLLFSVEGDARSWGSQFWVWTTEISYFPLHAADAHELTDPFFNMYAEQLPACRKAAEQRWGAQGAYYLEAGPFDGPVELPANVAQEYRDVYLGRKPNTQLSARARAHGQFECVLTQFADDRGPEHMAAGRYSYVSHIASSGCELALQAWWRYRYTGDLAWLRSHAYPLLKATVEFYRSLAAKGADGRYHLPGLNQHEGFWGVTDGNVDLAAIRGTTPLAMRAAEILEVDRALSAEWAEFLENLAPYPMGSEPESKALQGGVLADDVWSIGHLGDVEGAHHNPGEALLFPVFPFEDWTLETRDNETDRIVQKLAELNPSRLQILAGNSFGSAVRTPIFQSRTGRGEELPVILGSYYDRGFQPLPNGLSLFEGPNAQSAEHLGCVSTALQEALLQSVSGRPGGPEILRVFPAWPRPWDAAFRLLARGGFLVTAAIRDGVVQFVEIESRRGEECRVRNPWGSPVTLHRRDGATQPLEGHLVRFETAPGERYVLLRAHSPEPEQWTLSSPSSQEPVSYSIELPSGEKAEATLGRR